MKQELLLRRFKNNLYFCSLIVGTAGELVSPPKSRVQVNVEAEVGRDLYRQTHADFLPGEQKTRLYSTPNFNRMNKFGVPTPHDNTGSACLV